MSIIDRLKLPEARDISNLDDVSTTLVHARVIRKKYFLKRLYTDLYTQFKQAIRDSGEDGVLVELGSGGGFIKEIIPHAITSDILNLPNVERHFSALDMPFEDHTVDAFFMWGVFHHIKDARQFFKEVDRCLKVGGKLVMVEAANTLWGRFIYRHFHHEDMDLSAGWELKESGRLSSANLALPWIVLCRDRAQFEEEFPALRIRTLKPHTPFIYILSGGLSYRQMLPSFSYDLIKAVERLLYPLNGLIGTLLTIEIEKAGREDG